jgi:hypothetical protein
MHEAQYSWSVGQLTSTFYIVDLLIFYIKERNKAKVGLLSLLCIHISWLSSKSKGQIWRKKQALLESMTHKSTYDLHTMNLQIHNLAGHDSYDWFDHVLQ